MTEIELFEICINKIIASFLILEGAFLFCHSSPTVEIGRYQSHMESVHDRFIGYQFDTENCLHQLMMKSECYHMILRDEFGKTEKLYAFQLGLY